MKTILCFGDSNTYGLNPKDHSRFDYDIRWTGILDKKLRTHGFRIAEEGLCGRTTVYPDILRQSRRGIDVFPVLLESHLPLDYVIIMLGTNDCKSSLHATPQMIAEGMRRLIRQVREKSSAKILLLSPILLGIGVGDEGFDDEFDESSVALSGLLKAAYKAVADEESCFFLAASDYAEPSMYDREHMDENGHKSLANAVFNVIYNDIHK